VRWRTDISDRKCNGPSAPEKSPPTYSARPERLPFAKGAAFPFSALELGMHRSDADAYKILLMIALWGAACLGAAAWIFAYTG